MKPTKTIQSYDLVRVWRDKAALEQEAVADTMAWVLALCLSSTAVILIIWLA
jgi:hypothetical protein